MLFLAIVSLGATIGLTIWHWQLGIMPLLLELYKVINSVRYIARRLPAPALRTVSVRAHVWLAGLQLLIGALWVLGHAMGFGVYLWPTVAVAQLLGGLMLLRVTLHTWRHAVPFAAAEPLTDKELPTLSVLIPARNETDDLKQCLASLVASDYPKLEIIVLDDNSTNRRTPDIIKSFAHSGVRFVQGDPVDEVNWLAKNQAYARLRLEASGELLLFCGVDVRVEPETLRQLVQLLLARDKDMVSVLPMRDEVSRVRASLLQPMRYYWELCLPRRVFKRPPVLSTCWLIRTVALDRAGGFDAERRSITPEAYFARQAVVTDSYSFIRSTAALGLRSTKPAHAQYDTSVRMRYPQLHRRLELIALTTLAELLFLLGPVVGLLLSWLAGPKTMVYAALWFATTVCLWVTYYIVAVSTRLNGPFVGWLLMPVAFMTDIYIQHASLLKYEFGHVVWKGRDTTVPVMGRPQLSSRSS